MPKSSAFGIPFGRDLSQTCLFPAMTRSSPFANCARRFASIALNFEDGSTNPERRFGYRRIADEWERAHIRDVNFPIPTLKWREWRDRPFSHASAWRGIPWNRHCDARNGEAIYLRPSLTLRSRRDGFAPLRSQ